MKKFAPIVMVALLAVAFTSCKKDYTCECKDKAGAVTNSPINGAKKSDAKKVCDASNTVWSAGGGSCTLK